jgi:hypothetical protein
MKAGPLKCTDPTVGAVMQISVYKYDNKDLRKAGYEMSTESGNVFMSMEGIWFRTWN